MGEFIIWGTFLGVFLFLVPVFVYVDFFADARGNKLYFSISLYRVFRIFGGYGELRGEGIAIHLTKKYALLLPYSELAGMRKRFEITKGFQLWRLHQVIEITKGFQLWRLHQVIEVGGVDKVYAVLIAAAIEGTFGSAYGYVHTLYPFVSMKNSALFSQEPCLKVTNQTAVVLNGLVLTVALTKKALEALINWIKTKKSMVLWKKRQRS